MRKKQENTIDVDVKELEQITTLIISVFKEFEAPPEICLIALAATNSFITAQLYGDKTEYNKLTENAKTQWDEIVAICDAERSENGAEH